MMGASHAASGLMVGLGTAPAAPVEGPFATVAWVAAWSGFSLLPDLDTNGSTAARMWGVVTKGVGAWVGGVAGGHRKKTHDIVVAPVIVGLLVALAAVHPVAAVFVLAVSIGLALLALDPVLPGNQRQPLLNAVVSWGLAVWLVSEGAGFYWWLPFVAAGGVVVHCLGDWPTLDQIPVPFTCWTGAERRFGPRLFKTNGRFEKLVAVPVMWAVIGLAAGFMVWRGSGLAAGSVDVETLLAQGWGFVRGLPVLIRDTLYSRAGLT